MIKIRKAGDKSVCQIKIALCWKAFRGVKNYTPEMVGLYREKVGQQVHKSRL